jgi:hypothetical protein
MVQEAEGVQHNGTRSIQRSVVGVIAGDDVDVRQAGLGIVLAKHDVSVRDGAACMPVIAGGAIRFDQGGTCGAIAGREVTVGRQGFLGIALAPKVTVEAGGKVLMTVKQAAAFGAVLGAALLVLLGRSRRGR